MITCGETRTVWIQPPSCKDIGEMYQNVILLIRYLFCTCTFIYEMINVIG